jgi:(+)-pinoresinol hydroxylase
VCSRTDPINDRGAAMILPPGVHRDAFTAAVQAFANVVGDQWVFSKDEDIALYNDAYTPFFGEPDKQHVASAAVAPSEVEQVQQIVRIANKYRIPLYTISTGRNLGYGGSSPNYSGSVVLDLKRMNRIIEVNTDEGYMIVEPGVSFIDVQRYFDEHQIDYVPSSPQPGWGSPIGNGLDHGVGNAYGDNFSAVVGLEVVLATGEVLRTGRGALPDARLWACYHYGFGPYIDGMFSQSNFGVVTKGCFWLKPRWEVSQSFTISSYSDNDMQPMIDALKELRNHEVINGFGIGSPIRQSMATNDGRRPYGVPEVNTLLRRRDGGSSAEWEALAQKTRIPVVEGGGGARGPAPIVKAQLDYAVDFLQRRKVPGTVVMGQPSTKIKPPMIDFGELALSGTSHGHYYFSPIFKQTREDIFAINDTMRNVMLDAGDFEMIEETGWWASRGFAGGGAGREKHMLLLMEFRVYDDLDKNRRRRQLFLDLVKACGEKGWGEYRAPVAFHDQVMDQFSFNNHILRRFYETIYDALDPNGILSPGKNGVWPRHLRKA